MDEDAAYRASSQYRLWSFTPLQLRDRRTETNQFAAEKVRAAFARANANNQDRESSPEGKAATTTTKSRDPLTVDEEQVIVQWGCSKIIEMKDHLDPRPSSVIIVSQAQRRLTILCYYGTHMVYDNVTNTTLSSHPGHSNPISPAILPLQLPHDISPNPNNAMCVIPRHESRAYVLQSESLHYSTIHNI